MEEFVPLEPGQVRMYTCGPTVYDFAHIGNFRAYMFEDLLRRFLKFQGLKVTQVMNLTDVDDKTIRGCRTLGMRLAEFTEQYKKAFFEDLDTLRDGGAPAWARVALDTILVPQRGHGSPLFMCTAMNSRGLR